MTIDKLCYNPNLGLVTKARASKSAGQEGGPKEHLIFLGMQESVRE